LDYILSLIDLPLSILEEFPIQPIKIEPILEIKQSRMGSKLGLKDFDFIRCIGMGGFSKVYLVRERSSGSYFAMKLIEK
jgi:serum/glucocorticoid-regulated kinase 2